MTQTNNTQSVNLAEITAEKLAAMSPAEIANLRKQVLAVDKQNKVEQKNALSKERQEKLNKVKGIHTQYGYTDVLDFIKDLRIANLPPVLRSRIPEEKRNKIMEAIKKNQKVASIAVEFQVSEGTVGNIRKMMNTTNPSETN